MMLGRRPMLAGLALAVLGGGAAIGQAPVPAIPSAFTVPVDQLGIDAFRFASTPARGGLGFVFQASRVDRDTVRAEIRYFFTRAGAGTHHVIALSVDDYRRLVDGVDRELARDAPSHRTGEPIMVCADGPGYRSERWREGSAFTLSGFCGNHPNNAIAILVRETVDGAR